MADDTRWVGLTEYCNRCGYRVESLLHEAQCGQKHPRPTSWVIFLDETTYSEADHIRLHGMGASWDDASQSDSR